MATITMYTTPTCGFCHMAKEYFNAKGVKFEAIDVASDQKAAQSMVEKSGQMGVPVIDIDGKIVVGFDRPKIDMLLREAKAI